MPESDSRLDVSTPGLAASRAAKLAFILASYLFIDVTERHELDVFSGKSQIVCHQRKVLRQKIGMRHNG